MKLYIIYTISEKSASTDLRFHILHALLRLLEGYGVGWLTAAVVDPAWWIILHNAQATPGGGVESRLSWKTHLGKPILKSIEIIEIPMKIVFIKIDGKGMKFPKIMRIPRYPDAARCLNA